MDALRDSGRGLVDALLRGVFTQDGQLAVQRLVTASAVPFLASFLWHHSCTVVEVTDGEQSRWLQHWLAQQTQALRRVRRLLFVTAGSLMGSRVPLSQRRMYGMEGLNDDDDKEVGDRFSPPKLIETPSAGVSVWTWFGWYPISIEHQAPASRTVNPYSGEMTAPSTYAITVWFAPNGAEIAKKLILQGRLFWQHKRASKTEVLMSEENYAPVRFKVLTRPSRPLSSVIVDGNKKEQLLIDATQFLQAENWYISKGIPYRRGYLLYGNPGCGKSSLVTALAGELRLPIVLVPLNSKRMDDRQLLDTLSASPKDSIVLIEDVDCAFGSRHNSNKAPPGGAIRYNGRVYVSPDQGGSGVTLSGLLNAIDGVAAQEGRLLFMTTNHRERLDPALIRPGRVDMECCLENASKYGAGELFDQFYGNTEPGARSFDIEEISTARAAFLKEVEDGAHSYAKLQGVLMDARDDPSHAAKLMRSVATMSTTDVQEEKLDVVEGTCNIGVSCDCCGENPIFGGRYKCNACPDYDLCSACYQKQVHKEHPFIHFSKTGCKPEMLPAQQYASGVSEKDGSSKKMNEGSSMPSDEVVENGSEDAQKDQGKED